MNKKEAPKDREYRYVSTPELVVEQRGEKEVRFIRGTAVKFNQLSNNLGWFREKFEPRAFDNVLEGDIVALFNHNPDKVLARTISKTLRVWQDEIGLHYEFEAPDNTVGNDLVVSMQRGDIQHSSFAFSVAPGGAHWSEDPEHGDVRTVTSVSGLYDVSPVVFPAYPQSVSEVSKRSYDQWKHNDQDHEAETQALEEEFKFLNSL
jgi:uncharacterized protein